MAHGAWFGWLGRVGAACAGVGAFAAAGQGACIGHGALEFGFYAYFQPLSYSQDPQPGAPGFSVHRGFEADLVTALEELADAGLSFSRRPIAPWDGIWLRSVAEFDVVGGGITILETRTRDAAGDAVVRFTDGHVAFRQSLLVRAEDAERYATHDDLTGAVRVGALAGTTGEARLLQLAGLADAEGNLAAGTRVETAAGVVTADGTGAYRITAAEATANLAGRQRLLPPDDGRPQVIYLGETAGEQALIDALAAGEIDAVARGEIGNRDAAAESGGRFAVTAVDRQAEYGGFTVRADRTRLLACLNERIAWLTAGGAVGYAEWRADAAVFRQRTRLWNGLLADLDRRGGAARPLAALFGDAEGAWRYQAASSDPALVTAHVAGDDMVLALSERGDGIATVTLTAVAGDGATTTLRLGLAVQPTRLSLRGWRNALGERDG